MLVWMKTWLPLLLLLIALSGRAQEESVNLQELLQGAQEWAAQNLDTNLLDALPAVDQQKTQVLLRDLQERFQGEYVINLAALRETANVVLPLLEAYEETQPYAAWLRPRLDYLKVADELQLTFPAPKVDSGEPPKPLPNPSAADRKSVV